jgi:hypothetical protein
VAIKFTLSTRPALLIAPVTGHQIISWSLAAAAAAAQEPIRAERVVVVLEAIKPAPQPFPPEHTLLPSGLEGVEGLLGLVEPRVAIHLLIA